MKEKHGDKKYVCTVVECGREFARKDALKRHHLKRHNTPWVDPETKKMNIRPKRKRQQG